MKVKHVLMIAAVLLAMLAVPVSADETVVTYTPTERYNLVIPEGMTVGTAGDIGVEGLLQDYSQVTISVSSGNDWQLKLASGKGGLGYALTWTENNNQMSMDADGDLMTVKADEIAGTDNQKMVISATAALKEGVKAKYQGDHTDLLTFTATEVVFTPVDDATELSTAISEGKDVILTKDITVTSTLKVAAGNEITIDLNGNDISYEVDNEGKASAIFENKGDLTITGEGTLSYVASNPDMQDIPSYATNTITNTGSGILTIGEGVTVENHSNGPACYAVDVQSGIFTLDGGTLIGERCALRIAKFNADSEFIMNSGTVRAPTPAWIHLPGSDAAVAPKITVTINGGTFQSTKESSADNDVLYTYSFGNSHANTKITINGGSFLGGTVSIGSGYKGDAPTLTINGGIFEYDVLQWLENDQSNVLYSANKQ